MVQFFFSASWNRMKRVKALLALLNADLITFQDVTLDLARRKCTCWVHQLDLIVRPVFSESLQRVVVHLQLRRFIHADLNVCYVIECLQVNARRRILDNLFEQIIDLTVGNWRSIAFEALDRGFSEWTLRMEEWRFGWIVASSRRF